MDDFLVDFTIIKFYNEEVHATNILQHPSALKRLHRPMCKTCTAIASHTCCHGTWCQLFRLILPQKTHIRFLGTYILMFVWRVTAVSSTSCDVLFQCFSMFPATSTLKASYNSAFEFFTSDYSGYLHAIILDRSKSDKLGSENFCTEIQVQLLSWHWIDQTKGRDPEGMVKLEICVTGGISTDAKEVSEHIDLPMRINDQWGHFFFGA